MVAKLLKKVIASHPSGLKNCAATYRFL
jgi:hypothetical protein